MSASTTIAAVSEGVFLFVESSSKMVSLRSPGSYPQRAKRYGSGSSSQFTPFFAREALACRFDVVETVELPKPENGNVCATSLGYREAARRVSVLDKTDA